MCDIPLLYCMLKFKVIYDYFVYFKINITVLLPYLAPLTKCLQYVSISTVMKDKQTPHITNVSVTGMKYCVFLVLYFRVTYVPQKHIMYIGDDIR